MRVFRRFLIILAGGVFINLLPHTVLIGLSGCVVGYFSGDIVDWMDRSKQDAPISQ